MQQLALQPDLQGGAPVVVGGNHVTVRVNMKGEGGEQPSPLLTPYPDACSIHQTKRKGASKQALTGSCAP